MYRIWVNTDEKIASFKAIDGYTLMEFRDTNNYWSYVHRLTEERYRFQ